MSQASRSCRTCRSASIRTTARKDGGDYVIDGGKIFITNGDVADYLLLFGKWDGIDDPKAGWKGRAIWTTSGTRAMFHNEGGTSQQAKVYKVQMRPDPLAH